MTMIKNIRVTAHRHLQPFNVPFLSSSYSYHHTSRRGPMNVSMSGESRSLSFSYAFQASFGTLTDLSQKTGRLVLKRNLATTSHSTTGHPNKENTLDDQDFIKSSEEPPILPAQLLMETGEKFSGLSFGSPLYNSENKQYSSASGEVVFTTSLVGYPESMTDPSYRGQILVFTQPLIGNYGVPAQTVDQYGLLTDFESENIHVKGIIVNDYALKYSHWKAVESLGQWCAREGVFALSGVDTRALVTLLRERGTSLGKLFVQNTELQKTYQDEFNEEPLFEDANKRNLVAEVSVKERKVYNPQGKYKIALIGKGNRELNFSGGVLSTSSHFFHTSLSKISGFISKRKSHLDCGVKHNIIRLLAERNAQVHRVPWNHDITKDELQYDGVFISNGPGDPSYCVEAVQNIRKIMATNKKLPIFGICMGNQLLGMAAGYKTYKLPFGNRGHNQPALNLTSGQCVITSQNHGYALQDDVKLKDWTTYFRNANDGSNEGIRHLSLPYRSVQFHPEAKGGPRDTEYLFDEFLVMVENYHDMRKPPSNLLSKNKMHESSSFKK